MQLPSVQWGNWMGSLPLFAISALIPICVRKAIVNTLQLPPRRPGRADGRCPAGCVDALLPTKVLVEAMFTEHLNGLTTILLVAAARSAAIGYPPDRARR